MIFVSNALANSVYPTIISLKNPKIAEVGFASGEGANYIYIDCKGEGGHGVIEFVGYFQEANEDNSFIAI